MTTCIKRKFACWSRVILISRKYNLPFRPSRESEEEKNPPETLYGSHGDPLREYGEEDEESRRELEDEEEEESHSYHLRPRKKASPKMKGKKKVAKGTHNICFLYVTLFLEKVINLSCSILIILECLLLSCRHILQVCTPLVTDYPSLLPNIKSLFFLSFLKNFNMSVWILNYIKITILDFLFFKQITDSLTCPDCSSQPGSISWQMLGCKLLSWD